MVFVKYLGCEHTVEEDPEDDKSTHSDPGFCCDSCEKRAKEIEEYELRHQVIEEKGGYS